MEVKDDYNLANRYKVVRKRLDVLGYKQILSIDALPLVESLLADLIQTTDSLKHFKTIAQDNIEVCSELQLAVDPYKCDNAKLVQENNRLHAELFETKETYSKQVNNLKKQIRKLENDNVDFQLRLSKNIQKIKEIEVETAKKSKRILELQGKCVKPTISNVSLGTKSRKVFPLKKSVLEFEPLQNNEVIQTPLPSTRNTEPYIIDFIQMADQRMNCLNQEVIKLRHELSVQTDNISCLNNQLITKEKEILRLRKMLEGGRPYNAVNADCYCKKSDKINGIRNGECNEIDVLRQSRIDLEQQLKEAINKQHDAMTQAVKLAERNEALEKELKDLDHLTLAVEADCTSAVKEKDKKVQKLQEKIDETNTQVCVLENELTIARREMQELRADLESAKSEKRSIQRILESTLEEKKHLTDRINELTLIEQKSKCQVEKLKQDNANQKNKIQELERANKKLKENIKEKPKETEKPKCQESTKKQENKIMKKKPIAKSQPISKSPGSKDKNRVQTGGLSSRDYGCGTDDCHQQSEKLRSLEIERDFYKKEYNKFKEQYTKDTCGDNVTLWDQSHDLKKQVLEKEREIAELLREKKELYHEKMDLEIKLQSLKPTQRTSCSVCNPCIQTAHNTCYGNKECLSLKTKLERAERARDLAKGDIERLIQERDALRERIKMTTEAHQCEQRRLKKCVNEVETRLKKIECDRQELVIVQGTQRATVISLEAKLIDAQDELQEKRSELLDLKTQYSQLRSRHEQADHTICDLQGQLAHAQSELSRTLDRNKNLEHQQLHLDNQTKELKQEINTFRCNISQLERQKEQLELELEERMHKISSLEKELMSGQQQALDMQRKVHHLEQQNQLCLDQKAEQERQIKSLQSDINNMQRQLMSASMEKENVCMENRRLQEDLTAMTCELRTLQRELESSRCESVDLKRQLQTYVSEVRRFEELLDRKECERTDMLEHFKSLSMEATVLENNNHSLESEAAKAKGALQTAKEQICDLERQLSHKDCMIRGYESQISETTQSIATLEAQLRQQSDQRQRAETDLNAVRNLCIMLERQKDSLLQQIKEKDEMKAQYEAQLMRLRADCSAQQDQMGRDHAAVDRLEDLLARSRQETMDAQALKQKLENEVCRLEQKTCELQTKLSAEKDEVRRCQMQLSEYDRQIAELKRQMTNERFDRALRDEEKRRSPNSTPDSIDESRGEVMSYNEHQCKLNYLKKMLPRFETGLIESPCIRATLLRFIKSHNIKIEIFELNPKSDAQCKNNGPCYKLKDSPHSFCKKKVHFGAQSGDGNISHEILASCTQQSNDSSTRVVHSGTNVREEEFNRNLNFKHSECSCHIDNSNESQKLDKATGQDVNQSKNSDYECEISNYTNVSTLPVPTVLPSQFPPTPSNTLENSTQRSDFEESSSYNIRQGTSPEILRSTPTPIPDQNRLQVPTINRTRSLSPSFIGCEDPVETATSNEINLNDEVSEELKATSKKLDVACECLFNKMTQKSPKHVELVNNMIKRFENLMECEEQLQKKKKNIDESTIIDDMISKLTSILQESVEQYQLSGDIRKAQTSRSRSKSPKMAVEQFQPLSASSRRNSPIPEINLKAVALDVNRANNETALKSRDQNRADFNETHLADPEPKSRGFLSLWNNNNSRKYVNGCRDKSKAAVSGSETSDSDDTVEAPMPQRIWKSPKSNKYKRSKSRLPSSTPKQIETSCSCEVLSQSVGISASLPHRPPEINIIQPSNETYSGVTFSEIPTSYSSVIMKEQDYLGRHSSFKNNNQSISYQQSVTRPSTPTPFSLISNHRPEHVSMDQSFTIGQNKVLSEVCSIQRDTVDESFSWIPVESSHVEPETPQRSLQLDQSQNCIPPSQPELTIRSQSCISQENESEVTPNSDVTHSEFAEPSPDQVRSNDNFPLRQTSSPEVTGPPQNCSMKQDPTDSVMYSPSTSYMRLPSPRSVTRLQSINQTTSPQCNLGCSIRDESDKTVRMPEAHDDLSVTNKCLTLGCSKRSRVPVLLTNQRSLSRVKVDEPRNKPESVVEGAVTKISNEDKIENRQEEIRSKAGNVDQQNEKVIKDKKITKCKENEEENERNERRVLSTGRNSNTVFYNKSQMRLSQEKRKKHK